MIFIKFLIIFIPVLINESCGLISCRRKFTIVVDGGSTDTTLHIFEFTPVKYGMRLNLTSEVSTNIALSQFAYKLTDWGLMRIMFSHLTQEALNKIPPECYNSTPIYVQVTAGIRQIKQAMSTDILNYIRNILLRSQFQFKPEFVGILSSEKEGRLAWVSVNFLLGKFQSDRCSDTVGVLDLGGGSMHIAFATINASLIPQTKKMVVFGQQYHVYSDGYDHMGIDEIRIAYLNAAHCIGLTCQNQIMRSECLHPNVTAYFHFGNRSLNIGGMSVDRQKRFAFCYFNGISIVQNVKNIMQYFWDMKFVAISDYYYIIKAAYYNIDSQHETDVIEAQLIRIYSFASYACENPLKETNNFKHFRCLDLSYITQLLYRGFGFDWLDVINFSKKIKGTSLSWALGYAISML